MHLKALLSAGALLLSVASAAPAASAAVPKPDQDGKYWIHSEGLSAAFIPYGASITNLLIKDKNGIQRDIAAGFDNASYYEIDKQHPHFGGVPGRYANRIRNSSFVIDGVKYKVTPNDNPTKEAPQGADTLHGGSNGWDYRNFTVVSHSNNSISFSIIDPDGKEGFPGEVIAYITYTLTGMTWDFKMIGISTSKKTPIMLTNHGYWNLDGFSNTETNTIFDHTLHLPYSGQIVAVDDILIPTGDINNIKPGSVNDFFSAPKKMGANFSAPALKNNCGNGCVGYDNCWLVNREAQEPYDWRTDGYVASMASAWSGIRLDIYSDQDAFQFYSCNFQDGTMALKKTQGLKDNPKFPRTIPKYGCVVLEVQDYIDGINQPQWGRSKKQIFGPGDDPLVVQASYRFSVNGK